MEALLDITDKSTVHAARFLKEIHDWKEIEGKTSGECSQQSALIMDRQAERLPLPPKPTPRSAILRSSTIPLLTYVLS